MIETSNLVAVLWINADSTNEKQKNADSANTKLMQITMFKYCYSLYDYMAFYKQSILPFTLL